jgi:diguanylate cyclase (GGDEF)-like protein
VVALFDLDRFKERNDHHGHAAGDEALIAVVDALGAELRATDVIGRWGGDELLLVVPETAPDDVRHSAERWRAVIADLGLAAGPNQVTTSIGLATYRPGDDIDTLLIRADRALYSAKRQGGDAVATDAVATDVAATDAAATDAAADDRQAEADVASAEDGAPDG